MKKMLLTVGLLSCMMVLGTENAHAQQVRLDDAIRNATTTLSGNIGANARIAVLAVQADPVRMSDYLINELIAAFVGLGRFTVVNRAQLDLLASELHFNMSGYVDDMTAQSIGRFMGVQSIVTGTFESLGGFFRFRVQVVEVETAAIRGIYTADVQNDAVIAYLRGTPGAAHASAAPPQVATFPGQTFNRFSSGQRWGTWFLNGIIPGLGSFIIMRDTFGGWFQVICGIGGYISMFAGVYNMDSILYITGLLSWTTQVIFNIARSVTFGRNAPAAMAVMPPAWDIAFVPGRNGIEGITLSHTRRF